MNTLSDTDTDPAAANKREWERLERLFRQRDKPVVAWVSSNSGTTLEQVYRRFWE